MIRPAAFLAFALLSGHPLLAGELDAEYGPKGPARPPVGAKSTAPASGAIDATTPARRGTELDLEQPALAREATADSGVMEASAATAGSDTGMAGSAATAGATADMAAMAGASAVTTAGAMAAIMEVTVGDITGASADSASDSASAGSAWAMVATADTADTAGMAGMVLVMPTTEVMASGMAMEAMDSPLVAWVGTVTSIEAMIVAGPVLDNLER